MKKELYKIRWRGKVSGPHDLESLRSMLSRSEVSLLHEVLKEGRWIPLEELVSRAPAKSESAQEPRQNSKSEVIKPQGEEKPTASKAAPPPPPNDQYYLSKGGQQEGPYSITRLRDLATAQLVSADDVVWKEGMSNWVALSSIIGPKAFERLIAREPQEWSSQPPQTREVPLKGAGGFTANEVFAHAPKEIDVERPEGVQIGVRCLYVSVLLNWIAVNYLSSTMQSSEQIQSVIGGMIGVLIAAFFVYKASKGRNWARIVLLILSIPSFFYATFSMPVWFNQPTGAEGWFFKLQFFAAALSAGGIVWLFTPKVSRWYARIKAIRFAELLSDES
jgi:hypothetical protein